MANQTDPRILKAALCSANPTDEAERLFQIAQKSGKADQAVLCMLGCGSQNDWAAITVNREEGKITSESSTSESPRKRSYTYKNRQPRLPLKVTRT